MNFGDFKVLWLKTADGFYTENISSCSENVERTCECIYTALELADSVLAAEGVRDTAGLAS